MGQDFAAVLRKIRRQAIAHCLVAGCPKAVPAAIMPLTLIAPKRAADGAHRQAAQHPIEDHFGVLKSRFSCLKR